jgi:MscS family membrane protein
MDFGQLLNQRILGNRVENIVWCVGILLFGFLLKRVASLLISRLLFRLVKKESENLPVNDFMILLRRPLEMLITLIFLYTAFSFLRFPPEWNIAPTSQFGLRLVLLRLYQVMMIFTITWIVMRFVDFFAMVFTRRAELNESALSIQLIPFTREVAKVFIVLCSVFIVLGVIFNLDVGSIVAGLGIGGLAVALAGKESLENLFASFTIFLDRPFTVGEVVQVGGLSGKVEKVGFRSTRIRTLDKSTLTIPNKMLIDQPLDNMTQRRFRRANLQICITYDTPIPVMRTSCEEVRQAISEKELTKSEPAVVHFTDFGESSLNITVIYFVETADWMEFSKVREEINYRIIEIVSQNGAQFAFPTRTVHVEEIERTFLVRDKE